MSRRGPVPGTTGRTPAEVARTALHAHRTGQRMAALVASRYGITDRAASAAISRARQAGHDIPYDLGWSQYGPPGQAPDPDRYAHGTASRYRTGCRCDDCRGAHAWSARLRRLRLPAQPRLLGVRYARTTTIAALAAVPAFHACTDCGHQAATGWELAAHTLERHGRTLVATERVPIEVAA